MAEIIPGELGDGTCYESWGDWDICRLGPHPTLQAGADNIRPTAYQTASFWIFRGFLYFDLTHLALVVQTAELRVYGKAKGSVDITAVVTVGTQSVPLVAHNYQAHAATATVLGSIATPDVTLEAYNSIVLNPAGVALVQSKIGGILKLCLKDEDDNNDNPMFYSVNRNFQFYSSEEAGKQPLLVLKLNFPHSKAHLIG